MTTWRCKDVVKSFNKASAELMASAIADGCAVTEWKVGELNCFVADGQQAKLKQGLGVYGSCGACVNVHPRVWTAFAGSGKIDDNVYLPKLV